MYKGEKKFENLQVDLKKGDFYWIYMIFSGWGYIVLLTYRQTQPTRLLCQKVLVIPRKWWLGPNLTEKLFTGTLRINRPINILCDLSTDNKMAYQKYLFRVSDQVQPSHLEILHNEPRGATNNNDADQIASKHYCSYRHTQIFP